MDRLTRYPATPGWRYRRGGLGTVYKTPTAAGALEPIAAVGRLAEERNHHADRTGSSL